MGSGKDLLDKGGKLMALAGVAFVGYAIVFLALNFWGEGFELGVNEINGASRQDLMAFNPAVLYYIGHLHVATAGFIAATGITVVMLSWYGVRQGLKWAWTAAVVSPVVGLGVALPMHYLGLFEHNWILHLGPIYVATALFVYGVILSWKGLGREAV
ncbi:hypothetical protein A2716_02515 [candidate division WWE3 bacterium RIFCSPHIGHO2_01_FULL_40_23]|uniref:Uncharacterized protein n=1 Tax=candidate division WWE3 bacterium RIFCSPLOWO2_01_FULL_41_18 TaxID=1802625 RepID=A0A1F4VFF9_UNCKA|nr:MAG: hypothetical protein A2716_02515 [candidate division WWE3 bacterium RIFCSPHIGHO2_01_FULL_40_23]OGC55859.1 MAG: hypothetical protein A3A78_02365 [candidate division WWE3 bacterium RIFCSPLOWO2_01_FULL_41_18]